MIRDVRALVAVAVVLLLTLFALGSCSGEAAAPPLVRVDGSDGADVDAPARTVTVPAGEFSFRVGEPVDSVTDTGSEAETAETAETAEAPDGSVFVPVAWSFAPLRAADPQSVFVAGKYEPTTISLVAGSGSDEVTTELEEPYQIVGPGLTDFADRTYYVSVDEADVDDLRLTVSYDGLTQTLDPATGDLDAGAAEMYADQRTADVACPRRSWKGQAMVTVDMYCRVTRAAVPYLPSQGWVEDGRQWTVLTITTEPRLLVWDSPLYLPVVYRSRTPIDGTILNNRRPVAQQVRSGNPSSGQLVVTLAFDTPAGEGGDLLIRRGYDVSPRTDQDVTGLDAPVRRVVFTRAVELPAD